MRINRDYKSKLLHLSFYTNPLILSNENKENLLFITETYKLLQINFVCMSNSLIFYFRYKEIWL